MSSTTIVIVVEGVLKQNSGESVIPQGMRLYHSLKDHAKVALVSNSLNEEVVEHWLKVNGFTDHVHFIGASVTDPFEVGGTRKRQLSALREYNNVVEMVIEPDPEVAAILMEEGYTVAAFLHPRYSRPEFRPDYVAEVTPWESLVAEVERQAELKASDKRVHDE